MKTLLYIISMAVAFTTYFNGIFVDYYFRIFIGLAWIVIWIAECNIKKKSAKIKIFIFNYILPWVFIIIWSFFIWVVDKPEVFNFSYISRMFSNAFMLIIAILNAYVGIYYFGKKIVKISFASLALIVIVNFIVVISKYSPSQVIAYLSTVMLNDFVYGSTMWELAGKLEIQGPTMVMGLYLIYFMLFDKETTKNRKKYYILASILLLYIGFKRTTIFACSSALLFYFLINLKRVPIKVLISISGLLISTLFFGYVVIVKDNIFEMITECFQINTMGRSTIYSIVAEFYELNPLFIGNGFCYVSKYISESIEFITHSEALRMYSEIGFIPFFIWLYHFVIRIPNKILAKFGEDAAKLAIITTVYVFTAYLVENTLVLYPMYYSFVMFSCLYLFDSKNNEINTH